MENARGDAIILNKEKIFDDLSVDTECLISYKQQLQRKKK